MSNEQVNLPMDAGLGEAHVALLAIKLAASTSCSSLIIEGDSLGTILAINDPHLFCDWNTGSVITDIQHQLLSIPKWKALKIYRWLTLVHIM
jgi:hypothetical protein